MTTYIRERTSVWILIFTIFAFRIFFNNLMFCTSTTSCTVIAFTWNIAIWVRTAFISIRNSVLICWIYNFAIFAISDSFWQICKFYNFIIQTRNAFAINIFTVCHITTKIGMTNFIRFVRWINSAILACIINIYFIINTL